MNIHKKYLKTWLDHVKALAEDIGPRGSTTKEERQASDYCYKTFQSLNLTPQMEVFKSAKSIYHPHLIVAVLMLLAFILYPLFDRSSAIIAALISLTAFTSQMLELSFRDNILRRLVPKAESQNVFAVMPPAKKPKQDLVLLGHVDSHRTPLIFRSPTWVKIYQVLTTIAFILGLVQIVLYIAGIFTQWAWIWSATIPSAISSTLLAVICIEADQTPFSAGANDNASSAGLLLTLAKHFQEERLLNTQVWLVCTGCEEVQHYGAIDFFRRHKDELVNPVTVVFEMLGCAGPAWLTKEGIIIPFYSTPSLLALAEEIAAAHPDLGAYQTKINGGNSEMSDSLRVGIPAITIDGMSPNKELLYWHQVEDTFDKMNPEAMARNYAFIWSYLQAIDTRFPESSDA